MNVRRWNATEIGLYVLEAQIPYYTNKKKEQNKTKQPSKKCAKYFCGWHLNSQTMRNMCLVYDFFYGYKNVSLCRHTKLPTKQIMSTINMFNNVVWNEAPGPSTRRCLAYLHFANLVDSVEQKKQHRTPSFCHVVILVVSLVRSKE